MNTHNIDQLLNKYWEAETTITEENLLKEYFKQENVSEEHRKFIPLFQYFGHEKSLQATSTVANEECIATKNVDLEPAPTARFVAMSSSFSFMNIAATMAVLFCCLIGYTQYSSTSSMTGQSSDNYIVYDDEAEMQEAYELTMDALNLLSSKLNKGQNALKSGMSKVERIDILN